MYVYIIQYSIHGLSWRGIDINVSAYKGGATEWALVYSLRLHTTLAILNTRLYRVRPIIWLESKVASLAVTSET